MGIERLELRRVMAAVINEIHFNPLFGDLNEDQYVEIRGNPNEVLPNGTYLVGIDGDTEFNGPGSIHTVFDLSGLQLGSDGALVLAQQGSNYAADPGALVLKGTNGGFRGLRAPSDPGNQDRFAAISGNQLEVDVFDSNTFLLIHATGGSTPDPGEDIDANNDGVPDNLYLNWTIQDGVSWLYGANDVAYANLVFARDGLGIKSPGAQTVTINDVSWVGRRGDTTGSLPSAWVVGQTVERDNDPFVFRLKAATTFPPVFAGRNLDHVGAPNFFSTVKGVVFHDENADGVKQPAESGLANFPIFLDQNNNGELDFFQVTAEPDALLAGTKVRNIFPGATLTTTDANNIAFDLFEVDVVTDIRPSTGNQVFAHSGVPFFYTDRKLRIDFYEPASSVSIDITAFVGATQGRMRVFNASGVELETTTTIVLADTQTATLNITRPSADIAYAMAYSEPGPDLSNFGRFDNLRYSVPERNTTSGAGGLYEIPRVATGLYKAREGFLLGFVPTFPAGDGSHTLNITNTNPVTANFGNRINQSPEIGPQDFHLNENSPAGTVVGNVVASDPDPGQTITSYQIIGGTGQNLFVVNNATGQIKVAPDAVLNFEATDSYTLEVRVRDSAVIAASSTGTMTIHLNDVNEPITGLNLGSATIAENAETTNGAVVVGALMATDIDLNPVHTFSLVAGPGDNDNALFEITGNQLRVKQGVALDHEAKASLKVRVQASDGVHVLAQEFTISVEDVNEPATLVSVGPDAIRENVDTTLGDVTIGELITDDPDAETDYTFALAPGEGDDDNALVLISGSQLQLKQGVTLDRETKNQLSVRVLATDGVHPVESQITIEVSEVNEFPQISPQSFLLAENSALGTFVGTVAASDPDVGQSLQFSLAGDMATAFAIHPATGEITVADAGRIDFEANPAITLIVKATDNGDPALTSEAEITVDLSDVPDAPEAVLLDSVAVPENANTANGSVVAGHLSVVAPNGGDLSSHEFSLVAGEGDTHNAYFEIDGDTLRIRQGTLLDFETLPEYAIRIRASNGVESTEANFSVAIVNVNEPLTNVVLTDTSIDDGADTTSGPVTVGTLLVVDPDAPGAFAPYTFSLVAGAGGADNGSFQITGDALQVKQGVLLNHSAKSTLSLRVRATDGENSFTKVLSVQVTDGNKPPIAQDNSYNTQVDKPVTIPVNELLANDGDPDGVVDPSSITIVGNVNGTAVLSEGVVTFTPDSGFLGDASFAYTISDNEGGVSQPATVTIHVIEGPPWQNSEMPEDTNGDGIVEVFDLLTVVQYLRDHGQGHEFTGTPGDKQFRVDVDGNGVASMSDVLMIVNRLRTQQPQNNGEPERQTISHPLPLDDPSLEDSTSSESLPLETPAAPPEDPPSLDYVPTEEEDDRWENVLDEISLDVSQSRA